eukprot:COSAG05_NODE_4254_length_1599_cov_1.958667_2_plen_124_part_00
MVEKLKLDINTEINNPKSLWTPTSRASVEGLWAAFDENPGTQPLPLCPYGPSTRIVLGCVYPACEDCVYALRCDNEQTTTGERSRRPGQEGTAAWFVPLHSIATTFTMTTSQLLCTAGCVFYE